MHLYLKYIKRGAALLLIFALLCMAAVPRVYASEEAEASEETSETENDTQDQTEEKDDTRVSELENQRQQTLAEIDDLKDSISDVKDEIDGLEAERSSIQSFINSMDKEMSVLADKIADFEEKIENKKSDIETTKEELEEAEIACEEQYESMKKRIQFIYENPAVSLIEVLLSSGDIVEFLNRADFVASMSDYDREMMDKLTATQEEIALKEETLNAELEELEMMQEELESQKQTVNASINIKKGELSAKAGEISDASGEQSDYEKQLEEQEKLLDQIEEQIAKAANPNVYQGSASGFIWPCPAYTRISSYFGPRTQPVAGASTNHKGVDLAAPYGSDILASADGIVTTSTYSSSAGNYIVIAHGNGISTVYMHASSLLVSVGETVSQGQVIAKVGSTGYSTGNHLHFGVIKNGVYVDPLGYI